MSFDSRARRTNAVIQWQPSKKLRENCDQVETHRSDINAGGSMLVQLPEAVGKSYPNTPSRNVYVDADILR